MPAWKEEIHEAEEEGVALQLLRNPVQIQWHKWQDQPGVLIKMELGEPDSGGRRRPVEIKGSEYTEEVDFCD